MQTPKSLSEVKAEDPVQPSRGASVDKQQDIMTLQQWLQDHEEPTEREEGALNVHQSLVLKEPIKRGLQLSTKNCTCTVDFEGYFQ